MSADRTIIIGGGGFGRELISWAADCAEAGTLPPLAGLVDDNPAILEDYEGSTAHLGSLTDFQPKSTDSLLIAIGNPATKKRVAEQLRDKGGRFASLIHPRAAVSRSAKLDEGVVLCPLSAVSADARVGRLVIVNLLSSVGHDARVGDYCTLSAHVDLTGFTVLGEGVLVGSGARLVPKVKVGDGATIGAGATVYRSVAAGTTAYTAPAKVIRPG